MPPPTMSRIGAVASVAAAGADDLTVNLLHPLAAALADQLLLVGSKGAHPVRSVSAYRILCMLP